MFQLKKIYASGRTSLLIEIQNDLFYSDAQESSLAGFWGIYLWNIGTLEHRQLTP
jgi:hypothetical protein